MSQIHPVQILLDEHRAIETVLDRLEATLATLDQIPFPASWLTRAMSFFRYFVEGAHHTKEEERFFPALQQAGLIEQVTHHLAGVAWLDEAERRLGAAASGDREAIDSLRQAGLAYVSFLREHIAREDEVLHRAATQPATALELVRLHERALPRPLQQLDEEIYEKYLCLAKELTATRAA
ncbi:MAG TPA: hemerythrin domain-containing protein [Bryobacterales bacterium]|nr:hemerythrin domain-containing protein [Bryobacterales bacterium]